MQRGGVGVRGLRVRALVWGRKIVVRGRTRSVVGGCHSHRFRRECLWGLGNERCWMKNGVYMKDDDTVRLLGHEEAVEVRKEDALGTAKGFGETKSTSYGYRYY